MLIGELDGKLSQEGIYILPDTLSCRLLPTQMENLMITLILLMWGVSCTRILEFIIFITVLGNSICKFIQAPSQKITIIVEQNLDSPLLYSPLPTNLTLSLSSSTSNVGLTVAINGSLISNGVGLSKIPVFLSYSVTDGRTWNEISAPVTAFDGSYSALWTPSTTGEYMVKAWAGTGAIQEAMAFVDFAVVPFDETNVFSVTSNSTISSLTFEPDDRELKFVVSGPEGTAGYVEVIIAKSLVANIQGVEVKLNNTEIDYATSSIDDSWLLSFNYPHSSHTITINLKVASQSVFGLSVIDLAIIGIVIVIVCGIIVFLAFRRKRAKRS